MKNIKSFVLVAGVIFTLVSCGGSGNNSQGNNGEGNNGNGNNGADSAPPVQVNIDEAVTINSFDLSEAFRKDRSIAWKKFGNKSLLITDLLVYDVYNDGFNKKAVGFPYNPTQKMCGYTNSDRMFTFKGQPISNNDVEFKYNLNLASPEEMDKVGMLDYEAVVDNDFQKTVSMYAVLKECNFGKKDGEADNLKTNWCHLNFEDCEIVSDKKK
jgi:hypothetical protein